MTGRPYAIACATASADTSRITTAIRRGSLAAAIISGALIPALTAAPARAASREAPPGGTGGAPLAPAPPTTSPTSPAPTSTAPTSTSPTTTGTGTAPTPTTPTTTTPTTTPEPTASLGAEMVADARTGTGSRYVTGATGPNSFDCSGLVTWVTQQVGVRVPRVSFDQYRTGEPVSRNEIQPGDLVFVDTGGPGASDVGIASGPRTAISATTSRGVMQHAIFDRYWGGHFVGARRITGLSTTSRRTEAELRRDAEFGERPR